MAVRHEPTRITTAVRATYAAFIGAGFVFANWASRIPQVRDGLHLRPAGLGLVLLSIAVGSILALPLAGVIVHRFGTRRTLSVMVVLTCLGLAIAAGGYLVGVAPLVVGLFVLGFGNGAWDVAMNVQGADVERHLGKSIMPRFHAGYSVGTVAGALCGSVMVAFHVSVAIHLLAVAVIVALVVPALARGFLPDTVHEPETPAGAEPSDARPVTARSSALRRWREPRTLLIGLVVLTFAFTEGAGNDWISVSLIDGYHTAPAIGTLGFATFLAAMTAGRWFGPGVLDRFGRVATIRVLSLIAALGVVLFVVGGSVGSKVAAIAFVGALLWGVGASLGFPVGMSAAADEPAAAAGRVSVVASIGYCSFLGGPPLIGLLGDHLTVLHALLVVAIALAIASPLVSSMAPPHTSDS